MFEGRTLYEETSDYKESRLENMVKHPFTAIMFDIYSDSKNKSIPHKQCQDKSLDEELPSWF